MVRVGLEDCGEVVGEYMCFFCVAACPCSLRCSDWCREFCCLLYLPGSFPKGIISGSRGGKFLEEGGDACILMLI
jgi:hypothetical protein